MLGIRERFPKGKGIRTAKREMRRVETKANARHQRKVSKGKGVRKKVRGLRK